MQNDLTSRMMIAPSSRIQKDDGGLNAMRAKLLMQQAASQPSYIQPGEPPAKAWAPVVAQLGSLLAGKAATKQENTKQKELADMLTGLVQGREVPGQMPDGQMGPGAIERVPYTENEKLSQLAQNPQTQDIALKRMFPEVAKPGDLPATVQQTLWYSKQTPELQATFDRLQRAQQVLNLGGTQAVLAPTGGIKESFQVTPKPDQLPEFQGQQEAAKKTASLTAEERVKASLDLPKVEAQEKQTLKQINELLNHPGLSVSTGAFSMAPKIPGTKQADFIARYDQLKGTAFLDAYTALKGGGTITEVEGKKAESAKARMDRAQSEREFRTALTDFRDAVQVGTDKLKERAGQPTTARTSATTNQDPVEAEMRRRGLIK